MKRILSLLIFTMCLLCLFACSLKKDSISIAGISEGGTLLSNVKANVDLSPKYKILDVDNKFNYELGNEIIVGSYIKSYISPYYYCDSDVYTATGIDGKEIEFRVNQDTKKVVSYMISYPNGYKTTQNMTYEECLEIAKNELSRFDAGEFVQVLQDTHKNALYIPECGDVFSYYFRKFYYGNLTNILVQIDVNTDGLIVQVNATDIFEFNEEDAITLNKYNQDEDSLIEEIRNIITPSLSVDNTENVSIEIQTSYFCKLKDGSINLICDVRISVDGSDEFVYVRVLKKV